jgi:hypothetical protein
VIIVVVLLQGCYTGANFRKLTDGKIIGYSSRYEGDSRRTGFAIYNKEDSIIWIRRPDIHANITRFYDTTKASEEGLYKKSLAIAPLYSELPVKLTKSGSAISISFLRNGKTFSQPQYSLNKKDTIAVIDILDVCNTTGFKGRSHYTGRDTTIRFQGVKIKCYIFEERYGRIATTAPLRTKRIYLEKKKLLPVRIVSILDYSKNQYNSESPSSSEVFRINFIADPGNLIRDRSAIKTRCE